MSLIDKLVNVKISISESVDSGASFSSVLLIGPAPTKKEAQPKDVAAYSSVEEVLSAGWTADEKVYKAAAIAFMNGASELYIAVQKEEADVVDILNAANEVNGWYGIAVVGIESTEYKKIADWAEANNKLFGFTQDCSEEITSPLDKTYNYAFGFGTKRIEDNENNEFLALAVFAKAMSYQAGSETWAYKTLSGVTEDEFTTADITSLKEKSLNYYVVCAGKAITLDGKTLSGEWIDVIRFRDWLLNDMQIRIYNLFIKNPKVPYTDRGISLIQNQMIASLKEGQNVGGIANTEYDEEGNEIPGFTTTVPTSSSIGAANKASRTLSGCTFTARLANAIHIVEISGTLTA